MGKLVDMASALASADPRATIYASVPFASGSDAIACAEDESTPSGLAYLLEVAVAQDVLRVWASWRDARQPSPEQAADAIIYYAHRDADQPVE
jgi:hypothetical protein